MLRRAVDDAKCQELYASHFQLLWAMQFGQDNATMWTSTVIQPILNTKLPTLKSLSLDTDVPDDPLPTWNVALQAGSLAINCILSLFGNFLVSFTLIRREQLILPSNRLVFNLTGTNFLFSLLVLPFVIASVAEQKWLFGIFWCNFTAFLTLLFGLASILTLAMIAIDRYYAIVKPMIYTMTITTSKSTAMLLWVWIQASLCSLPPLLGWSKFQYLDTKAACAVAWESNIFYTILLLLLCIFLPLFIMVTCYYFIFQVARAKCRKIHVGTMTELTAEGAVPFPQPKAQRPSLPKRPSWALLSFNSVTKGIRTICVVMGAFLVTWAPYVVMAVVEASCGYQCLPQWFLVFATWMMYFSMVGYPVVYGLYNRSIRKEIRTCLCPPGAKAKKGLPRRNSRRLSFSGSLLEYSPSHPHFAARRHSVEFGRASIDLGSLAFARTGNRKMSQDSGAVMTESDMDADLPFFPLNWFGRRSSSTSSRLQQFSARLHRLHSRRSFEATCNQLPILQVMDVAAADEFGPSLATVEDAAKKMQETFGQEKCAAAIPVELPGTVQYETVELHDLPSLEDPSAASGRAKENAEPVGSSEHLMLQAKFQHVGRGESIDEGIVNDCILQDIE